MKIAKEIVGRKCPCCGKSIQQIMFGKNRKGIQRYKCKECEKVYTLEKSEPRYTEEIKSQAIKAYYSGMSARQVGKLYNMSKANVLNWIKKSECSVDK